VLFFRTTSWPSARDCRSRAAATAPRRDDPGAALRQVTSASIPASHPPDKSLRDYRAEHRSIRPTGRRSWWAHFELTRINITPTILHKKIEGLRQLGAFMFQGHVGPLTRWEVTVVKPGPVGQHYGVLWRR
jgi:hypothetical protein